MDAKLDGWEHYEAAGHAIAEGRFADAEEELRTALHAVGNSEPADHRLLDTLDLLSHSLSLQGKLDEAERICRRLLDLRKQVFGAESEEVIGTLAQPTDLCLGQEKYHESEALALQILALRQNAFGPEHPMVADALDRLIGPCVGLGRKAEAAEHCRTALAIRERTLGPNHFDVAEGLVRLAGLVSSESGQEAEVLWKRAAEIYEHIYTDRETYDWATVRQAAVSLEQLLSMLARRAAQAGNSDEAERLSGWAGELFSPRQTHKYDDFVQAVREAGFYTAGVEDMLGWDRVTACSKKLPGGGYSGNSFWVTTLKGAWYLGTWGGQVYQVPSSTSASAVAIAWMTRRPNGTYGDFDDELKSQFGLEPVSDEDFDALPGAP